MKILNSWAKDISKLKQIDNRYILAYFTVRNIFRHCHKNYTKDAEKTIKFIKKCISDRRFDKIIFEGLVYDKERVERLYREMFKMLAVA